MRNAAIYDDDFDFEEPARRKPAARKGRSAVKKKKKGSRFGIDMTKVARYGAIGVTATVVGGIMVNALVLQKGHHPAPLFGKPVELATAPAAAPMPVPKPVVSPPPAATAEPDSKPATPPVAPAKPHHEMQTKSNSDDAIGRLLKTSTGTAAASEKPDSKTVLGVQKALVKLGYVLKPNGNLGPATKKAIEMFEKDRKLPVNGDLSRRLVKVISAESGVKID